MTAHRYSPGELSGAVAASGADTGSDAHYGAPLAEQRRFAQGRAVAVLGHRAALRITGEDRLSWLHSLMSQDLLSAASGQSRTGFFLTIQGRIDFDCDIIVLDDALLFLLDAAEAPRLAAFLNRMKFMLRVEIEDLSEQAVILAARAPEVFPAALRQAALGVFEDPWPVLQPGGFAYATAEAEQIHAEEGWSLAQAVLPAESWPLVVRELEAAGISFAGAGALEALRIAALKPRTGVDTDDRSIPHELDLLRTGVHLNKGCYKGQETIARVHNLGHPPRRLVLLHLDGSSHTLPEVGAQVFIAGQEEGRPLGTVTSAALHHEAGPIALAVIKRSAPVDAALTVVGEQESFPAAQTAVVSPDAGSVAPRPKLGRL